MHALKDSSKNYTVLKHNDSENYITLRDDVYFYVICASRSCYDCFLYRYQCFAKKHFLETSHELAPLARLSSIPVQISSINEYECIVIERASGRAQRLFFNPYELCSQCIPFAHGGEAIAAYAQAGLESFVLRDSFGFTVYSSTFAGHGFEAQVLGGNFLSTIMTSFPAQAGESEFCLYGALDASPERSALKAVMEFVERYAFKMKIKDGGARISLTSACGGDARDVSRDELYGSHATSSGFAAGSSFAQTLERACYELIERDALMRWWFAPQSAQVIEAPSHIQASFESLLAALRTRLASPNLSGRFMLVPSQYSVPVVAAFITSNSDSVPPALIMASGAHDHFGRACEKALSELRVGVLNFIARLEEGYNWHAEVFDFAAVRTPQDHARLHHNPRLLKQLEFLPYLLNKKPESFASHVMDEQLKARLMKDAYYFDATPPIFKPFGVHVVRSYIPGLVSLSYGFPLQNCGEAGSPLSPSKNIPHCFS
jgi:ribosomal protein S12 methylthiotransferase accessory factor YcaO